MWRWHVAGRGGVVGPAGVGPLVGRLVPVADGQRAPVGAGCLDDGVTQPRVPRLTNLPNLRDLGGLPTVDGNRTRPGVVFRSDAPSHLADDEVRALVDALGLRRAVDLRLDRDVSLGPDYPLADAGVEHIRLPIGLVASAADAPVPDRLDMAAAYRTYLDSDAPSLVAALRVLADEGGPVLVHCAAGKDRTGTLLALALEAVGVVRDAVVADYAATGDNMPALVELWKRRDPGFAEVFEALPPQLFQADADTMTRFLEGMDAEFGTASHAGPAAWVRAQGITEDEIAALRSRLVG
ncbi:MAG: protein-tyrosine-phosphatase [Mycobacterium sp.]|nr:protein-tyrosine-phosphatase [Mycobacterium sp.]